MYLDFMAQRCAKNWDDTCQIYLGNLSEDFGKQFLRETLKRRFCQIKPEDDGKAQCYIKQELVNPDMGESSPVITKWVGAATPYGVDDNGYLQAYKESDSCDQIMSCNLLPEVTDISKDPVVQQCITWGAGEDVLQKILNTRGENIVAEVKTVKVNKTANKMNKTANKMKNRMSSAKKKLKADEGTGEDTGGGTSEETKETEETGEKTDETDETDETGEKSDETNIVPENNIFIINILCRKKHRGKLIWLLILITSLILLSIFVKKRFIDKS